MGHTMFLDQTERVLGVESGHDDRGGADALRRHRVVDAEDSLRLIEKHRVTPIAQFVPTMFVRMLKLPNAVRESCTTCRVLNA